MRDPFHRANDLSRQRRSVPLADQILIHQELVREFGPGDIDPDDLAQAIRQLLDSGTDAHLLSPDHRATHGVVRRGT